MRIFIHDYAGHPFVVGLSRELAKRGFEVTHAFASGLLTPRGTLERQEGDPEGLRFREVAMNPNYRRDKYRFSKRRRYELDYGRELQRVISEEHPAVMLSGNTPSEPQWLAVQRCKELGVPFVSWVQDFYSIAVQKLAQKKSVVLGKLAGCYYKRIDRKCFENSAYTIPISEDFIPILARYGVPEERIHTIENWGAISEIPVRAKRNDWSIAHSLADKKVLMYSGTLAMKHNPEPLVQLATRLKGEEGVRIVVISEGPGADYIEEQARKKGLSNIEVKPFQPFHTLPDVLGAADVFLALLEPDAGIFSVPSKVLSYLCAGKPTVAAMPSRNLAARLLSKRRAGIVVDPGDDQGFVDAAESLLKDEAACQEMGERARAYAEENFEIATVCDRFEKVFEKVTGENERGTASAVAMASATT